MGEVYAAEDERLRRTLSPSSSSNRQDVADEEKRLRFEREAQTASALNHPNICTIFEINDQDDQPFLVMELLEGRDLRRFAISGARRDTETAPSSGASRLPMRWMGAHEQGIVHRESSPRTSSSLKPRATRRSWILGLAQGRASHGFFNPRVRRKRAGNLIENQKPDQPGHGPGHGRLYVAGASPGQGTRPSHRPVLFRCRALRDGNWGAAFSRRYLGCDLRWHPEPHAGRTRAAANPDLPPRLQELINKALEKDPKAAMPNCRRDARRSRTSQARLLHFRPRSSFAVSRRGWRRGIFRAVSPQSLVSRPGGPAAPSGDEAS